MTISGWTASGFEGVRDAFAANFERGLEVGAAFSAYHRGRPVVDLWGGIADQATGRPWDEDAMALVFSTTKGATAICANRLADERRLDIEGPVAALWPEFAAAGKAGVTVAHLLSHQAGLAWVDDPPTLDEALTWAPMIHALERQAPAWEPGTAHGYHAVTYGYLVGEVVRRVVGTSIGTYFHDELAHPLGLDFWIGLPEDLESRVAPLVGSISGSGATVDAATRAAIDQIMGPDTMLGKALTAGGVFRDVDGGLWNERRIRAAEIPAAGGVADARSLARMYAACIGEIDGIRLIGPEQLARATTPRTHGPDIVILDLDLQFGLGFFVPSSLLQLGGPRSFGHFGAGGSMGWADPEAELAFGYVMNRMDLGLAGDVRSYRLVNACYDALG
jgi:CubicO group peptidase (beta-lactamase class C family)